MLVMRQVRHHRAHVIQSSVRAVHQFEYQLHLFPASQHAVAVRLHQVYVPQLHQRRNLKAPLTLVSWSHRGKTSVGCHSPSSAGIGVSTPLALWRGVGGEAPLRSRYSEVHAVVSRLSLCSVALWRILRHFPIHVSSSVCLFSFHGLLFRFLVGGSTYCCSHHGASRHACYGSDVTSAPSSRDASYCRSQYGTELCSHHCSCSGVCSAAAHQQCRSHHCHHHFFHTHYSFF